jgi:hypothetical protein
MLSFLRDNKTKEFVANVQIRLFALSFGHLPPQGCSFALFVMLNATLY